SIGIVVAALAMAELVAAEDHRRAQREQRGRQQVALLPLPQRGDLGIVGRAFDAAIPGAVVGVTVTVVLAIGLVVLVVERDEVVEREPVMSRDEVDARPGLAAALVEEIARAGNPFCKIRQRRGISLPE